MRILPSEVLGNRYGRLIATQFIKKINPHQYYLCVCDCGGSTVATLNNLRRGNTKSCGCFNKEATAKASATHGKSKTPTYGAYKTMINRCEYKKHIQYADYGGRGITVCDRWKSNFLFFLEDMGDRPNKKYQLDRIDNNGPYCKENCRWVTPKENARNTSKIRFFEIDGVKKTLQEWASEYKMNAICVEKRLTRGWDLKRALTVPSKNKNSIPDTNEDRFKLEKKK